jgi:tetratricopeptide (TPR) repeat protein
MIYVRKRRSLLAVALGAPLLAWSRGTSKHPPMHCLALSGTYLQLLSEHRDWTHDDWIRLFGNFRRLQPDCRRWRSRPRRRRTGMVDDAERTLAAMGTASLSVSQRVARDEAIGELEERKGKLAAAAEAWGDADAVQPTAERAYRLGILAQGGHRNDEAGRAFELAQQRDPDNALYTRTLAYAYQRNGQILRAEAMFRAAVAQTIA